MCKRVSVCVWVDVYGRMGGWMVCFGGDVNRMVCGIRGWGPGVRLNWDGLG